MAVTLSTWARIMDLDRLQEVLSDRYRVERELGRGGMGVVYLVSDIRLQNRNAALKMIHPQLVGNPEALQRFEQEVATSLELLHPKH